MVSDLLVTKEMLVLSKIVDVSWFSVEVLSNEAVVVVEKASVLVAVDSNELIDVVSVPVDPGFVVFSNPVDVDSIASEVSKS